MAVKAIDISCWQRNIDFNKVKAAGISAVIIRAGYGREVSQKDSQFETHFKGAKAAGLKIGVYWYSYASTPAETAIEAKACLACIKGKALDLPVYFDMEESWQTRLGKSTLTAMAVSFCDTIVAGGYRAGIYSNLNWFTNYLNYSSLRKKYSIWLAQWSSSHSLVCDIWQYGSNGTVSGISGGVDMNIIENSAVIGSSTSVPANTAESTVTAVKTTAAAKTLPNVLYRVRSGGVWRKEVNDLSSYAGVEGKAVTDIAVKVTEGAVKYRVHIKGGKWLPYVTGYDIADDNNGYAGNGQPIDAIEVYYTTPESVRKKHGYLRAKYRTYTATNGGGWYDWQYDNEKDRKQDGYAGCFGRNIYRVQITLSK